MATGPGPHTKDSVESNGKFPIKRKEQGPARKSGTPSTSSDGVHSAIKKLRATGHTWSSSVEAGLKSQKARKQ